MFAGTDTEGSRDGLASPAEFCKPAGLCVACEQQAHFRSSLLSLRKIGGREAKTWKRVYCSQARICVEFDHVLYMCDAQPTVLVFTTLHETASFLHVVGKLSPSTRSMQSTSSATYKDVVTLLKKSKETLHYLRRNEALIRGEIPSLPTFSMTYSPRKEGVNGVNRIATKGEKYY